MCAITITYSCGILLFAQAHPKVPCIYTSLVQRSTVELPRGRVCVNRKCQDTFIFFPDCEDINVVLSLKAFVTYENFTPCVIFSLHV